MSAHHAQRQFQDNLDRIDARKSPLEFNLNAGLLNLSTVLAQLQREIEQLRREVQAMQR